MALTAAYANFDLATGSNDGTSEANAWRSWSDMISGYADGDHVHVKATATADDPGADQDFATSATITGGIVFEGYTTTPGDGGIFEFSGDRTITISGLYQYFRGFKHEASRAADGAWWDVTGDGCWLDRCGIINTNTSTWNGRIVNFDRGCTLTRSYVETNHTGSGGICHAVLARYSNVHNCIIKTTRYGIYCTSSSGGASVINNWIIGNGFSNRHAVRFDTLHVNEQNRVCGNHIYNFSVGVTVDTMPDIASQETVLIEGNVFDTVTTVLHNAGTSGDDWGLHIYNNAYFGETTYLDNIQSASDIGGINLTASPFYDPSNDDLRLNSAAGGGDLCRNIGGNPDATWTALGAPSVGLRHDIGVSTPLIRRRPMVMM